MNTACSVCKHYHMSLGCDAFPYGIPDEIASGVIDHTGIHTSQDNDIIFEHYLIGINNDIFLTY